MPGVRVRVPLRKRTVTGLVVSLTSTPDIPVDRLRPIEEVLDSATLLPDHLLFAAEFVSSYYRCPMGDTLAAMLPAALLRRDIETAELTPTGAAQTGEDLPRLQSRTLDLLRQSPKMAVTTLLQRAGAASRQPLEALADRGFVHLQRRRRDQAPRVEVAAVSLTAIPLDAALERCARAPRQREVLRWLAEQGRPALVSEVCNATGCSPAAIRALVAKKLLDRFTQRAPRRSRWTLRAADIRHQLTAEQRHAVTAISNALEGGGFAPVLLDGVTGSGKTEVYLRCLERVIEAGRGGLVLVPEIGLTPAAVGAVERRFGSRVAVLHSAQTDGERWREWLAIREGTSQIVVGPRSALFAPLQSPGLIIVDEEHDAAYKQQEAPRYHARDLALVLGRHLEIPVLLCSATPSAESASLVARGMASRLELTQRVAGGTLPEVEVIDLRSEPPEPGEHGRSLLSRRLTEEATATLARGEQIILLMQRRGWAPILLCRDCGHRVSCPSCSVALVVHRRSRDMQCHYCGYRQSTPSRCPSCSGTLLDAVGAGTEKVAELVRARFPDTPIAILDRDTVRRRSGLEDTLGAFAAGKAQILVGTQMVAKGHHFPNVTLTGVISADALLGLPDFRSAERTFQLLTQVGGRAGRGDRPGRVIIQTYYPEHPAVRCAARHDSAGFLAEELVFRRAFRYPPAARMALIRYESKSLPAVRSAAESGSAAATDSGPGVRIRGPAPSPLERLRGYWRWQILISAPSREILRATVERIESVPHPASVRRIVDVDPLSTL
jgi:primosomal protein N' (replication factor Y)